MIKECSSCGSEELIFGKVTNFELAEEYFYCKNCFESIKNS